MAHDAAGNADSSLAYWEAYPETNWGVPNIESWARPLAYRRLGEIYEARGERKQAAEYYNALVELWQNADPSCSRRLPPCGSGLLGWLGKAADPADSSVGPCLSHAPSCQALDACRTRPIFPST